MEGTKIRESDVTRAIAKGFLKDFIDYAVSDVIVVGAGPSGVTASMLLAREGVKTLLIEKDTEPGGGMWQGGMLFPKMVIESPADMFLNAFGIRTTKDESGFSMADSYYVTAKLLANAFEFGAKMFNSVVVEDVLYRDDGLHGVVVNWTSVSHRSMDCVDPMALESKVVIDCTGHHADVARIVAEKMNVQSVKQYFVGRESSMWVDKAEIATVEHTKEIYPNLIVAGMAANSTGGLPRMGPVFGGMILSGIKAAKLALGKINGGKFHKNNISKEVMEALV
ncbi:thiazole biosynthesis protein [Candidatus Micrarchaeota archaeon]|nr:thiazole biosynthesis protein [Candidatus Micrarchaeota archaeon]